MDLSGINQNVSKKTDCSPESYKTKRDRSKLEESLKKYSDVCQSALDQKKNEIHRRIAMNSDRVWVAKEGMGLFDNNTNPAEASKKVEMFARQLQETHAIYNEALNINGSLKDHEVKSLG